MNTKPILVTGAHRSSTTWVGTMLAASPGIGYVREPFALGRRPGICGAPFKYFFTFVSRENEQEYYPDLKKTLEFRFNGKGRWHSVRSLRAAAGTAKIYLDFLKYRLVGARPLLKDHIALFSAEWLAERFDMDVVVLIRHPAAFASSIKVLNWETHFDHLLAQPLLMNGYLRPYESQIREMVSTKHDLIAQSALFWNLAYSTVLQYRERHPDWVYVRHEDLSLKPIAGFHALCDRLGVEYTHDVEKTIRANSESKDISDKTSIRQPDLLKRNSLANMTQWKTRLSPSEIARLRVQVEDVSRNFYSDKEW